MRFVRVRMVGQHPASEGIYNGADSETLRSVSFSLKSKERQTQKVSEGFAKLLMQKWPGVFAYEDNRVVSEFDGGVSTTVAEVAETHETSEVRPLAAVEQSAVPVPTWERHRGDEIVAYAATLGVIDSDTDPALFSKVVPLDDNSGWSCDMPYREARKAAKAVGVNGKQKTAAIKSDLLKWMAEVVDGLKKKILEENLG